LAIKRKVFVFGCWRQIKGTRRRSRHRRWYQLRRRQTLLIFSHGVLRLITTHIGIYRWIRIGWKWHTWTNTSWRKSVIIWNLL